MKKLLSGFFFCLFLCTFSTTSHAQFKNAFRWVDKAVKAYQVYNTGKRIYDFYSSSYVGCDEVLYKIDYYYTRARELHEAAYYNNGTYNGQVYFQQAQRAYQMGLYYERELVNCAGNF